MEQPEAIQLQQWFDQLVDLPPHEQATFLEQCRRQDPQLTDKLKALHYHDRHPHAELGQPAVAAFVPEAALAHTIDGPSDFLREVAGLKPKPPSHIGEFRIVRTLGQGGMGTVYLAEQRQPQRKVAIKVIHFQIAAQAESKRLVGEANVLATLEHPGICAIYQVGFDADHHPWLVMELIDGVRIDTYCDQKKLTVNQRIALFLQACDALTYAHQKQIIHRDLKPDHLLVTNHEKALVKVIDFGLALTTEIDQKATREQHFVGTRGYAAPEQEAPEGRHLDTRCDIYALGAVLWQLLTGLQYRAPATKTSNKTGPTTTLPRTPRPASLCLLESGAHFSEAAAKRRCTGPKLANLLFDDLDWILTKALAHLPADRYDTVSELKSDLQRFLNGQPVSARPDTRSYQALKWIGRHTKAVVGGAVISLALIGSVGTALHQGYEAAEANQNLQLQLAKQEKHNTFLEQLLTAAHPNNKGPDLKFADLLVESESQIAVQFRQHPDQEIRARFTYAAAMFGMNMYKRALIQIDRALILKENHGKPHDLETQRLMMLKAKTLHRLKQHDRAGQLFEDILLWFSQNKQSSDETRRYQCETMGDYAYLLYRRRNYLKAETYYNLALAGQLEVLGESHTDTAQNLNGLGITLAKQARFSESENLLRRAVFIQNKLLPMHHPQRLASLVNLANCLLDQETTAKAREAAQLLNQVWPIRRQQLGFDHPSTLNSLNTLLRATLVSGEFENAAEQGALLHPIACRPTRRTSALCLEITGNYAIALAELGAADSGRLLLEQIQDAVQEDDPRHAVFHARLLNNLGDFLLHSGQAHEAVAVLREAVIRKEQLHGWNAITTWTSRCNLGLALVRSGRVQQGLCMLDELVTFAKTHLGEEHLTKSLYQTYWLEALFISGAVDEAKTGLAALQRLKYQHPTLAKRLQTLAEMTNP